MYLEVPLEIEMPETIVDDAMSGRIALVLHEHINRYTSKSLKALAMAYGLDVINVSVEELDLGWSNSRIVRLLARKQIKS